MTNRFSSKQQKHQFTRTALSVTQNFLRNEAAIQKVIAACKISSETVVLDIGAGEGSITSELLKRSNSVVAIEPESKLAEILEKKFPKLQIVRQTFENYQLPNNSFKTVSNIPFRTTSSIIKKLFSTKHFAGGALILQLEAAQKFAGEQLAQPNTMYSVIYGVSFDFTQIYSFKREDFKPAPHVKVVALRIERKITPLVSEIGQFSDLVAYIFNKSVPNISVLKDLISAKDLRFLGINPELKPSMLKIEEFVAIFDFLKKENKLSKIANYYQKILSEQSKLQKINRTRTDKFWQKAKI